MTTSYSPAAELEGELVIDKADFVITSVDDEIRSDNLCRKLLSRFYFSLLEQGVDPREATLLASGADHFVRDFVVGFMHRSLFDEQPGIVRRFGGNWYIVHTVEPSIDELAIHLAGVRAFFRFLLERDLLDGLFFEEIDRECSDLSFYEERIKAFWAIEGDGYLAWERECSLKSIVS